MKIHACRLLGGGNSETTCFFELHASKGNRTPGEVLHHLVGRSSQVRLRRGGKARRGWNRVGKSGSRVPMGIPRSLPRKGKGMEGAFNRYGATIEILKTL